MTFPSQPTNVKPVNREEQTDEFRAALDRIRVLGTVFQTLYEWHGSPGIGKSILIQQLLRGVCAESGTPSTLIDFADRQERNPRARRYPQDLSLLLEDLAAGFPEESVREVTAAIRQYRQAPDADKAHRLEEAARAFQRSIITLAASGPVVLFFDETERADPETVVAWLEEWIINPLVQNGRCLIVWAGRRPQRWKRFEVRRRALVQELGVFDEEATRNLFKKNSQYPISDLAIPVRKLTGGHPYAETILLRHLDIMAREGRKPEQDQFDRYEIDLLDTLVQSFVDAFAFKDLPGEVVSACRMMSMVRQFDIIMLREILTQALPGVFARYGRNEFGGLLARMRSTELVLWDDRRKGYAIDPTLRLIIGEHIRRHHPQLYIRVNRFAIEVYRDWIERAGDNRGIYIVEELYQQACVNQTLDEKLLQEAGLAQEKVDLTRLLKQRITEYHQSDSDLRASALDRLYHELENDPDLPPLIGNIGQENLLEALYEARRSVYPL